MKFYVEQFTCFFDILQGQKTLIELVFHFGTFFCSKLELIMVILIDFFILYPLPHNHIFLSVKMNFCVFFVKDFFFCFQWMNFVFFQKMASYLKTPLIIVLARDQFPYCIIQVFSILKIVWDFSVVEISSSVIIIVIFCTLSFINNFKVHSIKVQFEN